MIGSFLIYLILIPGLWFFIQYLSFKYKNYLKTFEVFVLFHLVLSLSAYGACRLQPEAGIWLSAFFAGLGWILQAKKIKWHKEYLVYLVGLPAIFRQVSNIGDGLKYQIRVPRDLFRFGIEALDGSSIYQGYINFHHMSIVPSKGIFVNRGMERQANCHIQARGPARFLIQIKTAVKQAN